MLPPFRLSIDLGTCHTVAVVRRGDEAPRALLFDGSPLLPSGVYADPAGTLFVGRDAERMSTVEPSRFEPFPKRLVDEGSALLGETEVPVPTLLAAVLRRVVSEAVQAGVAPVGATVLTCPADWGPRRRGVLLAAARAAELGHVELVDEPIAAATYCVAVLGQQIPPGRCLAIFDFGGGTLDVTVVRREPAGLRVLSVGGLDDLGGVDIDAALVGHLGQLVAIRAPAAWQRLSQSATPAEQRDRRAFWSEVRAAKEMLSRAPAAPVQVPGTEEALHLTREELERVAGPLIDRAVDETRRVLQRAGLVDGTDSDLLAGVFLVGGSSRIPLVASRLHARFGAAPTVPEQPELPVAHGGLLTAAGGVAPAGSPAGLAGYPPAPVSPVSPVSPSGGYPAPISGSIPGLVSGPPAPPGSPSVSFAAIPTSPAPRPPVTMSPPGLAAPRSAPPGAPRSAPPGAPPAPPRRRPAAVRMVAVVLAVLAACGGGATYGIRKLIPKTGTAANHALTRGGVGTGSGTGTGSGNRLGSAGKLSMLDSGIALTGNGAAGAIAAGGMVFYADVGAGHTTVYGRPLDAGKQRWQAGFDLEPSDVRLTVVGTLLVVDGVRARDNKDVRTVFDTGTGKQLWQADWDDRLDVAYLGTDEIVEKRGRPVAVQRVDLATGKTRWNRNGPSSALPIIDEKRIGANVVWTAGGANAPARRAATSSGGYPFHESFGVDPGVVVELDEDSGKGNVLDAGTGQVKATGQVPFDASKWIVYDGMIIGQLSSSAAPGKTVLAGYSVANLGKVFELPQRAGTDIDAIRPCGQHQVCLAASLSGGGNQLVAVDLPGRQTWTKDEEFSYDPNWYVLGGTLVYGDGAFSDLTAPSVVEPAGLKVGRALGDSRVRDTAVAGDGSRIVLRGVSASASGNVTFQVWVADTGTGDATTAVAVGKDIPKQVRLDGTVLTVVTADHKLIIARAPDKPAR